MKTSITIAGLIVGPILIFVITEAAQLAMDTEGDPESGFLKRLMSKCHRDIRARIQRAHIQTK